MDEEHTSLTAAVLALGDDAGRRPTIEEIAAERAAAVREAAFDVIDGALIAARGKERAVQVTHVLACLSAAGLTITQRRPE